MRKNRDLYQLAVREGFLGKEVVVLLSGFSRRFSELCLRCFRYNINMPNREILWGIVLVCYKAGFCCKYCGKRMEFKLDANGRGANIWTFEHKLPLCLGARM